MTITTTNVTTTTTRTRMIVALALIYVVFAILLNSVGPVILQSIATFGIDKPEASSLERYKDLTIAIASFLTASFLPLLGYRRAMMMALAIVGAGCLAMPLVPAFFTTKLLFACVGLGFAMTKVAVYSSIGLLTSDKNEHSRLMSVIEGVFQLGVLGGAWLFSAYVDAAHPGNPAWMNVYWLLAALCAVVFALLATGRLDESAAHAHGHNNDFRDAIGEMLSLFVRPLVYVFLASAFLYVLIEQSFGTWLPTFNHEVLHLPNAMAIQVSSILAGMTAIGRIGAGIVLKRVKWHWLLNICVLSMGALVLLVLPMARDVSAQQQVGWLTAPIAAYLIPVIGLLMAPIYPVINSVALSSLPKPMHAAMTGLIVVFSALGGTLGSYITARVFAAFGGVQAFYFSLVPMALLLLTLALFKRETSRAPAAGPGLAEQTV